MSLCNLGRWYFWPWSACAGSCIDVAMFSFCDMFSFCALANHATGLARRKPNSSLSVSRRTKWPRGTALPAFFTYPKASEKAHAVIEFQRNPAWPVYLVSCMPLTSGALCLDRLELQLHEQILPQFDMITRYTLRPKGQWPTAWPPKKEML